jgi:hypothetical protein
VVRTVIADAAKHGLPGEHHFFISFDTRADGVRLSPRMLAQYPQEMTVVLQHQFWDLILIDDGFEVGLSFGGIPERVTVPFAAITKFVDPSVQFGLQFAQAEEPDAQAETTEAATTRKRTNEPASRPPAEHKAPHQTPVVSEPESAANSPPEPDKPTGGGEVVRLDRFRKK